MAIGLSAAVAISLMTAASAFVATPGPALGVGGGHHRFRGRVSETLPKKSTFQASIILLQERYHTSSLELLTSLFEEMFFPRGRFRLGVVQTTALVGALRVTLDYILADEEVVTKQPLHDLYRCHDPCRAYAILRPPQIPLVV